MSLSHLRRTLPAHSGLHNGTFTIFSSDHCPFRYDDPHGKPTGVLEHEPSMKGETVREGFDLQALVQRKEGAFRFIPNGIPGVETRMSLLYTGGLNTGRISPQKFVELTSTNPAKLVNTLRLLQQCADASVVWAVPQKGSLAGPSFIVLLAQR